MKLRRCTYLLGLLLSYGLIGGHGLSADSGQGSAIEFIDSGQSLGDGAAIGIAMSDLDGDGDLDAFLANSQDLCRVWKNDGSGTFAAYQSISAGTLGHGIALGDLDGDGDADAFLVYNQSPDKVLFNTGNGTFLDTGQSLGGATDNGVTVELGDLDGDEDLDAVVARYQHAPIIWFNDGSGTFPGTGQVFGGIYTDDVALGDLDADGDLDAFLTDQGTGRVWLNNGLGGYTDSGQQLGTPFSWGLVALGDLDGDDDLDAFITNSDRGNRVWVNDGVGHFTALGSDFGDHTQKAVLCDVDGDGDLDALTTHLSYGNYVWVNDGAGGFSSAGPLLGSQNALFVCSGDVDGDGDIDAVIGQAGGVGGTRVFMNQSDVATTVRDFASRWTGHFVEIEWRLTDVTGVVSFEVYRRTARDGSFKMIDAAVVDEGDGHFLVQDRNVSPGSNYTYHVLVFANGVTVASFETNVNTPALKFKLGQNQPNPFGPVTRIPFTVEEDERVTLTVYDTMGRRVATLLNQTLSAGEYTQEWNGRDDGGGSVPSGVYFYRLAAGNGSVVRKAVLLK